MTSRTRGSMRLSGSGLAIAMMLATASQAASAQARQQAEEAGEAAAGDIIVTAQKRAERINDIGMSITASTGEQLKARGIDGINDFARIEPSFTYSQSLAGTPTYSIRGVGYNDFSLTAPPAVGLYTDEIPLIYSVMSRGADLDVDRVEVLKGPQGTLFGQNSTGGAINFVSARPTQTLSAGFEGSYERFGAINLNGYVSGGLTDTLRVRLAFDGDAGGAWQRSYTRDDQLGDKDFQRARILTEWTPTDRLTLLLNFNGWRDRSDTQAAQQNGILNQAGVAATFPFFLTYPDAPRNNKAADWDPSVNHRNRENFFQIALRAGYEVGDDINITSVSAYSEYDRNSTYQADGFNFYNTVNRVFGSVNAFSQELRLDGKSTDSRLRWVAGGNYTWTKASDNQQNDVSHASGSFAFASLGGPQFLDFRNNTRTRTNAYAAFGNLSFDIADDITLNAGGRYTKTAIDFQGCTFDSGNGTFAAGMNLFQEFFKGGVGVFPIAPGGCATLDSSFTPGLVTDKLIEDNVALRGGIDWKPGKDLLFYANITRGYKSGAFPTQGFIFSPSAAPVTQERVTAFETGFKVSLIDRMIQLNGAYFHYDYGNKQVNGAIQDPIFGTLFGLINIPSSKIDGFELSANVRGPIDGLALRGAVTYLDTKVTKSFVNINRLGNFVDFKGEAFPFTPKWAFSTGFTFREPISDKLGLVVSADYSYRSSTTNAFGRVSQEAIKGYGLLDAQLGIEADGRRWHAELFGQNLTNAYYWHDATLLQDGFYRRTGRPATYGLRVGLRY
ncbi:TonB-dependent receptor [Sphingosinicella soli]|uniref:Outer membrane receptor protein involved in Fe transport n=1 Tax=Sphingosinicella soli TaxID=333708 RepID=A0A7W7FA73_9SPHN|nr:TonB-dependent receptor [Sphingosinicella soli]MBB4633398.1 outer membrane receptor protein involved in Fe transport [Sphingosinicella soli]